MCLIARLVSRASVTKESAMCLYETDIRSNSVDDGKEILLSSDINANGKVGSFLRHETQKGSRSGIDVFLSTIFIAA